jgi:hypothetical protein
LTARQNDRTITTKLPFALQSAAAGSWSSIQGRMDGGIAVKKKKAKKKKK